MLATEIRARMDAIRGHAIFSRLRSVADVRVFMEHHVWAVWDFMSLLKSIQADVAPTRVPWVPPADADSARLINEIVAGEEGDDSPDGGDAHETHFGIYLRAMTAAQADSDLVKAFVGQVAAGVSPETALLDCQAPGASAAFVRTTMETCRGSLCERVAAFTLGREELIPGMFREAARELATGAGPGLALFSWYLDRHISMDGDRHGPMSAQLFERVCLLDEETTTASLLAARRVLEARTRLWDATLAAIKGNAQNYDTLRA
jgi:hypothetical protein